MNTTGSPEPGRSRTLAVRRGVGTLWATMPGSRVVMGAPSQMGTDDLGDRARTALGHHDRVVVDVVDLDDLELGDVRTELLHAARRVQGFGVREAARGAQRGDGHAEAAHRIHVPGGTEFVLGVDSDR